MQERNTFIYCELGTLEDGGGLRERKLLQHYLRMHLVVESNFDFACLFHGHETGHRMGGRRGVSEIVLR